MIAEAILPNVLEERSATLKTQLKSKGHLIHCPTEVTPLNKNRISSCNVYQFQITIKKSIDPGKKFAMSYASKELNLLET